MSASIHPCQKCGACCTVFKVSFESRETSENSFAVPVELTCKVSPGVLAMKYKNQNCARCVALEGHVGKWVGCQIYENRPSPCRNFKASYEDGIPNERCDECRLARGLAPLTPEDWALTPL